MQSRTDMRTTLRYGQVGGTLNAFIGGVHRKAVAIDEQAQLVAGCFSAHNPEANAQTGRHYGIEAGRIYSDYREMAEAEAARGDDRIDFVVICTPNNTHYEVAREFILKGIHIVCEKPLCFTVAQAEELCRLAKERGVLFCVTYTYTGYNMVKQAKQMIAEGAIGKVIDVKGEYLQDWLIDEVGDRVNPDRKLSVWRMNPEFSGISNCVGDIGTHIEETVAYMTGSPVRRVAAVLDTFDHPLDLNANMLVEFENGAHGTFSCSQVAAGHYNGLAIRIFGTKGSIEWEQEHPDFLKYTPKGEPSRIYTRAAHTSGHAADINRIPSGHPEGLTMAFANIYRTFTSAVLNIVNGKANDGEWDLDFPTVEDGLRGVKFIDGCVRSSKAGSAWVEL